MRDELLLYYERELTYLRQLGAEFAQKYPKIAGRLLLEAGKCEDPHVERLLEGFAFLAARVHLKIDDEFPQIVEALFNILYPNYLRPIPSMSVVQFHLDPEQGKLTSGLKIERGSLLYSQPVNGAPCKFRTCYETTLWPVVLQSAQWRLPDRIQPPVKASGAVGALRLELACLPDIAFSGLDLHTLRFFLHGEGALVHTLIELLTNNCIEIVIRDLARPERKAIVLPPRFVRQVGLDMADGMLPLPRRSFLAYRLLQEWFTFPEKFCFLDLSGFDQVSAAEFGPRLEVVFLISDFERSDRRQMLELGVSPSVFRLGCSPVVNLFAQTAEPILLEEKSFEYRIVPDARREQNLDIFAVEEVTGIISDSPEPVRYEPFYGFRHANARNGKQPFWHATRRRSGWRIDKGTDVYLELVDPAGLPIQPEEDSITVRLMCTNRDLPSLLPFGSEAGDFQLERGGPVTRIVALVKPTAAIDPPSRHELLWRLISQLSLNCLSLVDQGVDAFKEILRLHNFAEALSVERQIGGITSISSCPHFARLISENGATFARGTLVEIELDEERFVGSGAYTFSSVLDSFLGRYASMNSFSQLVVRTRQRRGILKTWLPRAGRKVLM
jgi:type VI secretion system protein ImpG